MTAPTPLFTVVVTDFDRSIGRDLFLRKMRCLAAQTCKDFEVIVYHDGPRLVSYAEETAGTELHPETRFVVTETRANDWGHTNRDRGIREARGKWIIHTNADNVFYPTLIEKLKAATEDGLPAYQMIRKRRPIIIKSILKRWDKVFGTDFTTPWSVPVLEKQILVYGVQMRGLLPLGKAYLRFPELAGQCALIFGGVPVKRGNIDAMQLVMRRDLWLENGGWYDKTEEGDGFMYEAFARKYVISVVPEVLGEHW